MKHPFLYKNMCSDTSALIIVLVLFFGIAGVKHLMALKVPFGFCDSSRNVLHKTIAVKRQNAKDQFENISQKIWKNKQLQTINYIVDVINLVKH